MKPSIPPVLIIFALVCFALVQNTPAVSPAPDGCYPNFTTAEGCKALATLSTGAGNTGIGWYSLFLNATGSFNTGIGGGALALNNADSNTAVGAAALLLNTTGTNNTAVGTDALVFNDSGTQNTADGAFALLSNTTGSFNTANGAFALFANSTGADNTANGNGALTSNTTGFSNTANGSVALVGNITGHQNTANGTSALFNNTTGSINTATGERALFSNTTGNGNTADGQNALASNTTGSFCTALGEDAGFNVSTANNVICIGFGVGGANVSNSCYIGSIFGQTSSGGVAVFIDSAGKLGTLTSSRRFKEGIKPMEQASEVLFALKPVTFRYKKEIDPHSISELGLVAEDVEKVNPDLVVRDKEGKPYSVRYEQVNAMLLNEFIKEHRKVEDLKKDFQATVAQLTAQLREQAAQIQKVSAQLEASKPAPQVVNNP